jgi:hypothetical protein
MYELAGISNAWITVMVAVTEYLFKFSNTS